MIKQVLTGMIAIGGVALADMASAANEPMKLTTKSGKKVILYSDKTWEFERAAPGMMKDTVAANDLVKRPDKLRGKDIVVSGKLVTLFGAYHLQATDPQNSILVDVKDIRRADQITLEKRMKEAGLTGSVAAQIQGTVQKGTITDYVKAKNVHFIGK